MKICFLAPANSAHTEKWCRFLAEKGHELHVVSFTPGEPSGATVHLVDCGAQTGSSDAKKLNYLLKAPQVRKLVRQIGADVISVHYATSYGAVAALAGLKNYVLSVWGSDIFSFPRKSPLHRALLCYSLARAPHLFSTSRAMAAEAGKYTDKPFTITPFGVDMSLFSPDKRDRTDGDFVIGTVKGLDFVYGIDVLIKAAALVRIEHPEIPLRLRIAGKGPHEAALRALAEEVGAAPITDWLGFVPQQQAAKEWADMDLAVVCSTGEESFGVSAVEAMACGCALIVSDAPGLLEVTDGGRVAAVVPRGDARALCEKIVELYSAPEKRASMGKEGRALVCERYEYGACFAYIERRLLEIAGLN